jgi:hypothetical protein
MLPGPRVVLDAPSPAIDEVKKDTSTPFRVAGAQRILYGDYAAVYGLEDIRSCAPLVSGELAKVIRTFPGVLTTQDWPVQIVNPVAAHSLLNFLNVKYLLTPARVNVQEGLGFRLAADRDLGVLENLEVWPRAFFSGGIVSISSTEEFRRYLVDHARQPFIALTQDEISKEPDLLKLQTNAFPTVAPANNYELFPNSTAFDVHASSAGVVCLTEAQARDFTATANGEPKTILTVNRAFKGIYIERRGDYHIQFTYRPRHWLLSSVLFWIAGSTLLVLLAVDLVKHGFIKKTGQLREENGG